MDPERPNRNVLRHTWKPRRRRAVSHLRCRPEFQGQGQRGTAADVPPLTRMAMVWAEWTGCGFAGQSIARARKRRHGRRVICHGCQIPPLNTLTPPAPPNTSGATKFRGYRRVYNWHLDLDVSPLRNKHSTITTQYSYPNSTTMFATVSAPLVPLFGCEDVQNLADNQTTSPVIACQGGCTGCSTGSCQCGDK